MRPNKDIPVGIVAGWGNYPVSVARALKANGRSVVVAGIRDHANPELAKIADAFRWFGIGKLGQQQRWLSQHDVQQVTMAGKLFKDKILFHTRGWWRHLPDWECLRTFYPHLIARRQDTRDDTLLSAIVSSFERKRLNIVPGTDFAPDLLVERGHLTRRKVSPKVQQDIEFAWTIAKQLGGLDIGQSVTVRDRTILAVEAIEGTDACIERTAQLCPTGGFTLVKVAKPHQDMRFDVPTIGLQTIERLHRAGGTAIAIEADKTILVDRESVLALADHYRIAIVAR